MSTLFNAMLYEDQPPKLDQAKPGPSAPHRLRRAPSPPAAAHSPCNTRPCPQLVSSGTDAPTSDHAIDHMSGTCTRAPSFQPRKLTLSWTRTSSGRRSGRDWRRRQMRRCIDGVFEGSLGWSSQTEAFGHSRNAVVAAVVVVPALCCSHKPSMGFARSFLQGGLFGDATQ